MAPDSADCLCSKRCRLLLPTVHFGHFCNTVIICVKKNIYFFTFVDVEFQRRIQFNKLILFIFTHSAVCHGAFFFKNSSSTISADRFKSIRKINNSISLVGERALLWPPCCSSLALAVPSAGLHLQPGRLDAVLLYVIGLQALFRQYTVYIALSRD